MPDYDSRPDTRRHIEEVRNRLYQIIRELKIRAINHDRTKLVEPELSVFNEYTPKLENSTYGSPEYNEFLVGMRKGLEYHYARNDHHPEHFYNGIKEMNLIQIIEMLADWKAATLRHADGSLAKSIKINKERFGFGDELERLLYNTAMALDWL